MPACVSRRRDYEDITVRGDMNKLTLEIRGSNKADGLFDFSDMAE